MTRSGRLLAQSIPWDASGYVEKLCVKWTLLKRWRPHLCVISGNKFYFVKNGKLGKSVNVSQAGYMKLEFDGMKQSEALRQCVMMIKDYDQQVIFRVTGQEQIDWWIKQLTKLMHLKWPKNEKDKDSMTNKETKETGQSKRGEESGMERNGRERRKRTYDDLRAERRCGRRARREYLQKKTGSFKEVKTNKDESIKAESNPDLKRAALPVRQKPNEPHPTVSVPKVNSFLTELCTAVDRRHHKVAESNPDLKRAALPVRQKPKEPQPTVSVPKVNSFLTELCTAVDRRRHKVEQMETIEEELETKTEQTPIAKDQDETASKTIEVAVHENGVDEVNKFDKISFMTQLANTLRQKHDLPEIKREEETETKKTKEEDNNKPDTVDSPTSSSSSSEGIITHWQPSIILSESMSEMDLTLDQPEEDRNTKKEETKTESTQFEMLRKPLYFGQNLKGRQNTTIQKNESKDDLPPPLPKTPPPKLEAINRPIKYMSAFEKHWNTFNDTEHIECILCKTNKQSPSQPN